MCRIIFPFLLLFYFHQGFCQISVDSIKVDDAKAIMLFLASDELKGRGNYSKELHKAAEFIAGRFKLAGLEPFPGLSSYYHSISIKETFKPIKDSLGNYVPENVLVNVIGMLKGKSKPEEAILCCAHYDHVGSEEGEIYNGANDNASGTTAMLLLLDYFSRKNDNERTLVFCAFAGEEMGLIGSSVLAEQINTEAIVAVINIEMIGISAVGKRSIFITGEDYSDLGKILKGNLEGKIKVKREPASYKKLFSRSDNYPFAKKGVPAHTIMSSDDSDRCYHRPCDDVNRIDFENMVDLIRGIALATEGMIRGNQTPKRINLKKLY